MPAMVKMISDVEHVYAGRALKPGDEFDCEPPHVVVMTTLGRARKAGQAQQYQTRDMSARRKRITK